MKSLKYLVILFSLVFSRQIMAQQETSHVQDSLTWYTDLMKATEISTSSGKPIFALFTGSDWCGWCRKLQNDVFKKPEFIAWAKKNVVLLELDFPRIIKQTPELKKQNNDLLQHFKVQGFPTCWMFYVSADTATKTLNFTPLGSTGYPGNAQPGKEQVAFLVDANEILAKKDSK